MKRLLTTSCTNASFNLAAFVLRITFGSLIFINHGLAKLNRFSELKTTFSDPLHIGHQASLLLAIFAEVFCAFFVIIGLFTRLAAIPLVITMAVVVFMVQKNQPFARYELASLFLGAFIAILLMGSGRYSVDGAMGK